MVSETDSQLIADETRQLAKDWSVWTDNSNRPHSPQANSRTIHSGDCKEDHEQGYYTQSDVDSCPWPLSRIHTPNDTTRQEPGAVVNEQKNYDPVTNEGQPVQTKDRGTMT